MAYHTPDVDSLPIYDIVHFQCGVNTNTELTIICYGKRFHINMSAENLRGNLQLEIEYLKRIRKLELDDEMLPIKYKDWEAALVKEIDDQRSGKDDGETNEEDEITGDAMEEICFWIAMKCNRFMRALGSDSDFLPATVEQWLYPETLVLTPKVDDDGSLNVESSPADDDVISNLVSSVQLPQDMLQTLRLPLVHPSKIFLFREESENTASFTQRPEKVFIEPNEILFFKPCYRIPEIPREIQTMARLEQTGLTRTLRVPTLRGLVQYQQKQDRICGLLLTYVQHGKSLDYVDINATSIERRNKWISQIQHTIKALHAEKIIWGDAKPGNILIDGNDDLWIIDFGGSFTHGWVDKDKVETVEGDCQAVERIVQFLRGEGKC